MLSAALSSHERSYDIPLVSTRQSINISDPIGYFGFFILNCASKSYTMDLSLNMLNPDNDGLSCEMIGMPAITRRLVALWSIVLACSLFDVSFNYWSRGRRADAWIVSKGMQPWITVCACGRLVTHGLGIKIFDDISLYGKNSSAVVLLMWALPPPRCRCRTASS